MCIMGESIIKLVLRIGFWYLVFLLFAVEFNRLLWSFWTKFWFVFVILILVPED